jgi:hypothetical protein
LDFSAGIWWVIGWNKSNLSQDLRLVNRAETIEKQEDGTFIVTSNKGTLIHASVLREVLGSFEPRKPLIDGINFMKTKGEVLHQRPGRI